MIILFEIAVSFLQAFIFTTLTNLYFNDLFGLLSYSEQLYNKGTMRAISIRRLYSVGIRKVTRYEVIVYIFRRIGRGI
jgi:hypothetical protein